MRFVVQFLLGHPHARLRAHVFVADRLIEIATWSYKRARALKHECRRKGLID